MIRRALALWLALFAAPALATEAAVVVGQSLNQAGRGWPGVVFSLNQGVVSTATLSAPFATPGASASPVTISLGGPVTDTRASSATYWSTATTIATATNDQLRTDRFGALFEPGDTNYCTRSTSIGGSEWENNGSAFALNAGTAPDGTMTASLFTPRSPGDGVYHINITTPSSTHFVAAACGLPLVGSGIVTGVTSGSGTFTGCTCVTSDGSACTPAITAGPFGSCTATTTGMTAWRCVYAQATLLSAETSPIITVGVAAAETGTVYLWGAELKVGTFHTAFIPTVATPTARATETATVPAVGVVGAATGSGVMTYTPEWSSATAGADRIILSTTGVVLKWLNASTAISLTAGGATATSAALTWAANSSHTLRWRYGGTAGSGACVTVDAAAEVCAGTFSTITPTDPIYLGGDASGGGGASLKSITLCSNNGTCP